MKNFQTLFVSLFLILISHKAAANKPDNRVTLGFFIMKPYAYVQDGIPSGAVIEFINNHLAPQMNKDIQFINIPLARLLREVKLANIDGVVMLGYTEDRANYIEFPNSHMQLATPVLALNKAHPLQMIRNDKEIRNLNIGYVKDAILSPSVKKYAASMELIYGRNTWERNIKKLLQGKVEAIYSPIEANMLHALNQADAANKVKVLKIPNDSITLYTAFSAHQKVKQKGLKQLYDKAFERINGRKVFNDIYKKHREKMAK